MKDYRKAIRFADKACILDENNMEARYVKGFCHRNLGEFTKAVDIYRQIINKYPDSAVAHLYLADCLRSGGCREDAIQYYLESIKLDEEGDVRELAQEAIVTIKESGPGSG